MRGKARLGSGGELAPSREMVDVWSAWLDSPRPLVSDLVAYLSPDERSRAARFVSPTDRDRFVTARAFLRLVLARRLHADPRELRFHYGPHGKPVLDGSDVGLRFNLAHSGALAVCALADVPGELGVDAERVRPIANMEGTARAAFAPGEFRRFAAIPGSARPRAFFEAWTLKEAFLKALGSGLARHLHSFEIAFGPGERARLVRSLIDPTEPARFSLDAFEPAAGYVGAVAVAAQTGRPRLLKWRWA